MKMDDQWLYNLRKRSENFERKAPDGLWEDIKQALDEQKVIGGRKKVVPLWMQWSAVAAAVLILVIIGFVALRDTRHLQHSVDKANSVTFADNNTSHHEDAELGQVPESDSELLMNDLIEDEPQLATSHEDVIVSTERAEFSDTMRVVDEKENNDKRTEVANDKNTEVNSVFDNVSTRKSDYDGGGVSYKSLNVSNHTVGNGRWSAGLYASNLQGSSGSSMGYSSLVMGANAYSEMPLQSTWATSAKANIMFNNLDETTKTEVKHHLPIRVGASVKYGLTDRWGVESGLVYTILKSELTSGSDNYYYTTEQTIHYLGIPVKANFTIWQNRSFKAYVSAGGMMEIPLSGKSVTDYVNRGMATEQEKVDVDIDRLQWSVSGAAGIQYNFVKNVGIYVEPGVGYYFDDGSDVLTVYKDKPFNFNLQVGVRFELN